MNKVDEFIKNPKKALFTLAGPIVIAMLAQTMYNIIDTAYVGRLGAEALAAITFCWPLFFILIALDSGIGAGMSSKISRFLGAKKMKDAENTAIHGLGISLILSVIVFTLGFIFLEPLLTLFGASGNVLTLSKDYMFYVLIAIFVMFPSYLVSSIFSAQGDTKTSMKIQLTSLAINLILDPIFIFTLKLGVKGAAIATLISFTISLLLGIYFLLRKSQLKIHLKNFKYSKEIVIDIFRVGMPATFMMLLISIYVIFINRFMVKFGNEYVAMFGVIARLDSVAVLPVVAFAMSLMTLVGMFYGAKRFDLLKSTIWYGIRMGIYITSIAGIIFFIFPSLLLRIFTPDKAILEIGKNFLRIELFTYPLMVIGMMISRAMQGMGYGSPGLVIQLLRTIIVSIPLSYLFIFVLNWNYLWMAVAMVIGGIFSSVLAIVWLNAKTRKLEDINLK